MKQVRCTMVSYLNTKPFLDGLENEFQKGELEIRLANPADCAKDFAQGNCEIALFPVGALDSLSGYDIMQGFCIGAKGDVASVLILSDEPLDQIRFLVPDPESRTSNRLAGVLLDNYWKQKFEWVTGDIEKSRGLPQTAFVSIGDKAMKMKNSFRYVYDLAGEWKSWTGMNFVFAVFICKQGGVEDEIASRFLRGLAHGVDHIRESAKRWAPEFGMTEEAAFQYLDASVYLRLEPDMRAGLEKFLSLLPVKA